MYLSVVYCSRCLCQSLEVKQDIRILMNTSIYSEGIMSNYESTIDNYAKCNQIWLTASSTGHMCNKGTFGRFIHLDYNKKNLTWLWHRWTDRWTSATKRGIISPALQSIIGFCSVCITTRYSSRMPYFKKRMESAMVFTYSLISDRSRGS